MERRRMDGGTPDEELAAKPGQYLRSSPGFVATQSRPGKSATELPRACRNAAALCARDGLHPHRADADRRTSVRRLVGLSSYQLLRTDQSLWNAGRTETFYRQM